MNQTFLSETDAAVFLGVPRRTLNWWRLSGRAPRHITVGKRQAVYEMAALSEWLTQREAAAPGSAEAKQ